MIFFSIHKCVLECPSVKLNCRFEHISGLSLRNAAIFIKLKAVSDVPNQHLQSPLKGHDPK